MLTADEALALLLGLFGVRRSGTSTAADSASAKLQRVLPQALADRLAAVVQTTRFTGDPSEVGVPDADTLMTVAEAVRDRRPLALAYTDAAGVRGSRNVRPYRVVAHRGRWYLTGEDDTSGEARNFRIDRIARVRPLPGRVDPPPEYDPVASALRGLATAPHPQEVVLHVQGSLEQVAALLPLALAVPEPSRVAGARTGPASVSAPSASTGYRRYCRAGPALPDRATPGAARPRVRPRAEPGSWC